MVECDEKVIEKTLTAATNVHRILGPGMLESVYEKALIIELFELGLRAKRQVEIPVVYKGINLGVGFRADLIVNESLLLELKVVDVLNSVHTSQVITYLKILNIKRGYLINFNKKLLKYGIKRVSI